MKKIILIVSLLFSSSAFAVDGEFCKKLIKDNKKTTVLEKAKDTFKLTEKIDIDFKHSVNWKQPQDTLSDRIGNLYDLAVLRYYALREMGIKRGHLKINYGYTKGFNIPNVTVYIFDKKNDTYYVLDYLEGDVINVDNHSSFSSVYRYDEKYLWTPEGYSGMSDQVAPWREVMNKRKGSICDF